MAPAPVQVYVIVVSVVTVALWCANTFVQQWLGNMGVVAVLPMIAFFGFGVLNKDDFNGFLWNVVMLAMGGSALGEAVRSRCGAAAVCGVCTVRSSSSVHSAEQH